MANTILSIQSHVVHGYVGNKAATFPLQYLGWECGVLNTTEFSNHPGYGHFEGYKCSAEQLQEIILHGLCGVLHAEYDVVIVGYLPDSEALANIPRAVSSLCECNKELKWVLDPVLGDNGRLYVPQANINQYKHILRTSHVYLVTPNQFEAELLTDHQLHSLADLVTVFTKFHKLYPKTELIVITSLQLQDAKDHFVCACYDTTHGKAHYIKVPKINAQFSGSGDLFTALLVHSLVSLKQDLHKAMAQVAITVQHILQETYDLALSENNGSFLTQDGITKIHDLKLIQCRHILLEKMSNQVQSLQIFPLDNL